MKNPDQLWFDIVFRFAQQSRCKSRKVGSIIVDKYNHLVGQGWNSAPVGTDTESCPRCNVENIVSGKDLHLAVCTHSEINSIAHASRIGVCTNECTMFCTTKPCTECTKAIISAGICEVVYHQDYDSPIADLLFKNANVKVRRFNL